MLWSLSGCGWLCRPHPVLDEAVDAVLDAEHRVAAVDAVPDERADGGVHAAARRADMHHRQRVAALRTER